MILACVRRIYICFFDRQLGCYFIGIFYELRTYIIFKRYKLLKPIDENDKAATNMLINRLYQTIPSLIFPFPRSYLALSLNQPGDRRPVVEWTVNDCCKRYTATREIAREIVLLHQRGSAEPADVEPDRTRRSTTQSQLRIDWSRAGGGVRSRL